MGMPALRSSHEEWTAELVRQLPDDGSRYEVVDGELLVSRAPSLPHQHASALLWRLLHDFLKQHRMGAVFLAPADVEYSRTRMVQPDVFVVPLMNDRVLGDSVTARDLLLAIEILSPSTARADRHIKRRLYQQERVPEYWIVDVNARLIERWRPDDERPEVCDGHIEWRVAGHAPTLTIDLSEYFSDVLDVFSNPENLE